MADRIVTTEQLMADMTQSCCVNAKAAWKVSGKSALVGKSVISDDEICVKPNAPFASNLSMKSNMLSGLVSKVHNKLTAYRAFMQNFVDHRLSRIGKPLVTKNTTASADDGRSRRPYRTYSRYVMDKHSFTLGTGVDAQVSVNVSDPMPCETWWDPFCCAAEVCADMMVEMMSVMTEGSENLLDLCEESIDEVRMQYLLADIYVIVLVHCSCTYPNWCFGFYCWTL
jgi:hypothetical protein